MKKLIILLLVYSCLASLPSMAAVVHYPARQAEAVADTQRTPLYPTLVIYGTVDLEVFEPFILGFQDAFPSVA